MDRENTIAAAVVSIVVLLIFVSTTALVVFLPPDLSAWKAAAVNQIVGAAISGFSIVTTYWVGSSRGSQAKDQTIAMLSSQVNGKVNQ